MVAEEGITNTITVGCHRNPPSRRRFLRITEDVNGRRDNIIVPSTGLEEFKKIVDEMVKASAEIPPKKA